MKTLEECAQEYVKALMNTPNAHGQNCHPVTDERSDYIMRRMYQDYGDTATHAAIDVALKEQQE
jgi:hypothetical protein